MVLMAEISLLNLYIIKLLISILDCYFGKILLFIKTNNKHGTITILNFTA